MNQTLRITVSLIGIAIILFGMVYGVYLPYLKSTSYIDAVRALSSVKSMKEFQDNFDTTLTLSSPIGGEETAKFLSNTILNLIAREGQAEVISRALVAYIDPYMNRSNVIHLLSLGNMYEILWRRYHNNDDFLKAEDFYRKALALGPKVPPVLFALYGLYREKHDDARVAEIVSLLTTYWPQITTSTK